MDTLFKVTAILGALAWLPQIIKWIVNWIRKPILKIIGDDEAQVGYIAFGSVLNVNLSFISQYKSSLIEDMELEIRDKNNSTYILKWAWYGETYYELKAPFASATMGKQQKAIAFVSYKDALIEKLVGFQSVDFRERKKELINKINQLVENQKYMGKINPDAIKQSNEYVDLMRLCDESLIWKKGDYTAICKVYISGNQTPFNYKFYFTLTETDISNLKSNIKLAKLIIEKSYFPNENKIEDNWLWANPTIVKQK